MQISFRYPECFLWGDQQQNVQSTNGCQCMRPCLVQIDGGECALAAVKATGQATSQCVHSKSHIIIIKTLSPCNRPGHMQVTRLYRVQRALVLMQV